MKNSTQEVRTAKTDCFAYERFGNGSEKCTALNEVFCKKRECRFYKKAGTLCYSCNKDRAHDCYSCEKARKTEE